MQVTTSLQKNRDDTVYNNDEKGATKASSQFALFIFILFICLFLFIYFFYFTFFFLHLPWIVTTNNNNFLFQNLN